MPGIVLGIGDTTVSKTDQKKKKKIPDFLKLTFQYLSICYLYIFHTKLYI